MEDCLTEELKVKWKPFTSTVRVNAVSVAGSGQYTQTHNVVLTPANVQYIAIDRIICNARVHETGAATESVVTLLSNHRILSRTDSPLENDQVISLGSDQECSFCDGYTEYSPALLFRNKGATSIQVNLRWSFRWPWGYGNLEPNPPAFAFYVPVTPQIEYTLTITGRYASRTGAR